MPAGRPPRARQAFRLGYTIRRLRRGFRRAARAERPVALPASDPSAFGKMTGRPLQAPVPLADHHEVEAFASVAPTLDVWIRRKTRANQASGASRSYVLCRGDQVAGFYALAAGSVSHDLSPRNPAQPMESARPPLFSGKPTEWGQGLTISDIPDKPCAAP